MKEKNNIKENKLRRGRMSKEEAQEGQLKVLSKLHSDFVFDSTGDRKITLEYQDIEKLWKKKDKRTYKKICMDISDFCTFVGLYERGIQVDKSTFFKSNLGKDRKIKERIAYKLCELLSEVSVNGLALGPGSSVLICTQVLAAEEKLPNVIVTNSLGVYDALRSYQITNLIFTGGQYKAEIHACIGPGAVEGFRNARCEVSIMGVSAINNDGELLVKYYDETDVLKQMLLSTSERIFIVTAVQKFVSRDTFPVVRIKELIEEINNVEVFIITNSYKEIKDKEKQRQAEEVAHTLEKIGNGKRVKVIWVDD